jgi:glycosyltransferase involved in cell wall biosynthesis
VLYPFSWALPLNQGFREADVVHYHLIHNSFFSIPSLPMLTRRKPSVWTLHDPWAMTGHCIHPFSCGRWREGCGACPDIASPKPLRMDTTRQLWNMKSRAYRRSEFDVVVPSRWMLRMAEASPLLEGKRAHVIPTGIDIERFSPGEGAEARPGDRFTIMVRASSIPFKGLDKAKEIIAGMDRGLALRVKAVDERGLMHDLGPDVEVEELGRVADAALISAFRGSDVFLMTSTAESFGMMAVEAMACGVPVVCLKDTAVEEVVGEGGGGMAMPQGDIGRGIEYVNRLAGSHDALAEAGRLARRRAASAFAIEQQAASLGKLYRSLLE